MRKTNLFLIALFAIIFTYSASYSQVSVTGGTGLAATYTTLTGTSGLFAAINGTAQTGNNIVVTITSDITEVATSADSIALKPGAWSSITISPSGARTISGAAAAGFGLIKLYGADNVTINGLNSGGNSLIISNTTASAATGTCTIRFVDGATNNTITNCTIKGSFSGAVGTNGGNIFFSTDGVASTGNDNNTISNCDITAAGSNLPSKGIYGNGSTTTTAVGNSGIVINNNNFYDIFQGGVQSSMIYTAGGCNSWSITNNKFYQTGTRTFTGTFTHSAINIQNTTGTSGAQGFTVTGNTIGYASNSQTGTYTLTGSTGRFHAIVFNGITGGTVSKIAQNTIAGISFSGNTSSGTGTTSSPFLAINATSGYANVDSNSIGSQSATGSIAISLNTTTTSDMYAIYNFSSDTCRIRGNSIGGINFNNAGASGTFTIYNIRVNTGTTVPSTVSGNTIGGTIANSIASNSTSTGFQMFGIQIATSPATITSNTIRNLTAPGGTGTGTGASLIGIATSSATSNNHTIGSNIIHTLSNTNTSGAVTVTGIMFGSSTGTNTIEKNFIHSFSLVSSSVSATMNGISVNSGTATYKNNMIRLGIDAAGSSVTAGVVINGINETIAGTDNFYHNSVYIGGTGVITTAANTYAFQSTITTNTRAFQNNIFWNARSNSTSTGKHYGIRVGGTTVNPGGLTSNYNVIYTNGTGGVFGFYNSADVASLSAWQTATGQDANSINNSAIGFIAPDGTSSTVDLHLHATNPTVCEGVGVSIGSVTDDYDGQTRSGLTPVDIGADAGNFVALDVTGPAISYTALGNIPTSNNQTLTATISDASGVPQSGANRPTLYYKSTTSVPTYTAVTGTYVSGNTYTFTFGSSVTGTGETVSYYIVAQDNASTPNLSCFPAAGASGLTANPPAAGTPPTTPSTYTTAATLSGTKTVGSGGDYATLKAAFDDINTKVLTANLTLSILAGGTTETATASLNAVSYFGGTFTITITPASGQTPTITGALNSTALIKLNGADNVVIDGSNTQTTTKDLTLTNTSTGASTTVVWLASQGTGAGCTGNTIKNCNINTGGNATATSYGIFAGSTTIGTAGDDNDNLTIQNNSITKCYSAINVSATATGLNNSLSITGNSIGSNTAGSEVSFRGMTIVQATGASVSNNTIFNLLMSAAGDPCGIEIGTGVVSSTFNANSISDVNGSNSGGYGGRGITVNTGSSSSSITISNNLIWNIKGTGWSTFVSSDAIAGILIGNTTATTGGLNIYFNTVNLGSGTFAGNASGTLSAALAIAQTGPTNLDIRNNIFATNLVNSAASGALTYAIYVGGTNSAFTSINYNCYYGTGTQGKVGILNSGTSQTTLAGWQGVSGGDANSTISDPVFTSSTDIHIAQSGSAYRTGLNGLSVTTDYTGAARNNPPSMGAYDAGINVGPSISYTALGSGVASVNQVLTATITDPVDGVPQAGSGLPTLYYKSTTSVPAYTAVQGVYVSGNSYSFTFGSSVTNSGETVSYYIVAQDNAGLITQVTCSPSTGASGFSVNPPAVSTPPTTPSTYTTVGALSGTKTVGSGGDYATLKAAFDDINAKALTGNLTLTILAGGTTETATASLNAVSYSGGTWTVTISPASGQTPTITGALSSTAIVKLNGADNVIIDGSNNGSTSKDLTITNSSTTAPSVIWLASQGVGAGCTSNTIKNCNLTTGIGTSTGYHVCIGGTTIGTSGADNDNVTVQNNTLTNAIVGIYAIGTATTSSGGNDNLSITQNTISSNSGNTVTATKGIQLGNGLNATVSQNSIVMQSSGASSVAGISLEAGFTTSTITRNSIQAFSNNTAGEGGRGITCSSGSASSALTISNNILYNINGSNWTGFNNSSSMGIALGVDGTTTTITSTAGGINIYNNSIYMAGNYLGTGFSGACLTACVYVGSNASALDIRNNIFENTLNNQNAGGTASKNYAIYSVASNSAFSTINYNTYYVSGAQGVLGFLSSDRTNLAGIVTGFGGNANSLNADPQFTSTSNLVPVSSATSVIPELNSGAVISGVTVDYNGAARSGTNPDMGAYEFTSSLDLTGAGNTTLPGGTYSGLTWTGNTLTCSGNMTVDGTLTLSNGVINMGANTLTIGTSAASTGTLTRTGGSIIGTVKRWFGTNTTTNSVFPLDYGDGTNYVGAMISFTGAPSTGGTLTATFHSTGAGTLSDNGGSGSINVGGLWPGVNFINLAQQYWTITAGDGLAGYTYDITLIANNMNVSSTSYLYTGVVKRSNGSQPWGWNQSNHVNTTSPSNVPTLGGTGFTSFSDFGVSGNMDNLLPVELAAFTANIDKRHVTLNWSTISESNNTGYDIERKAVESNVWSKLSFVEGHGTTALPQSYRYEDRNLATGKYNYRLKQIDNNGNYHYIPLTKLVEIGVPTKYDMSQNYPNPFNPSTKINFDLPFDSKVTIRLFDITGREVATILNQTVTAGYQTVQFNAAGLSSGTYFYNIMAEGNNGNKFVNTKKMVLVK